MASYHNRVSPIGEYTPLHIMSAATLVAVGMNMSTTASTTIIAGNKVVVTPVSMLNIVPGLILNFANGTGTAEDVAVITTSATTFTANFQYGHSGAYSIISRRGSDIGKVVVNSAGASGTLTLYNGHPSILPDPGTAFAVIDVSGVVSPLDYGCIIGKGLFYTLTVGSGGSAPDLTLTYIDHTD